MLAYLQLNLVQMTEAILWYSKSDFERKLRALRPYHHDEKRWQARRFLACVNIEGGELMSHYGPKLNHYIRYYNSFNIFYILHFSVYLYEYHFNYKNGVFLIVFILFQK